MFVVLSCPTCGNGEITVKADPATGEYADVEHSNCTQRCETTYANGWHDEAICEAVEAATAKLVRVDADSKFPVYAER